MRRRAAADARLQSHAAGLMAVVAAIVDVVGAIDASQQLQQKARFVAAASAEVPERFVGGVAFSLAAIESNASSQEIVSKWVAAFAITNRLNQATKVFQLARRELLQVHQPNSGSRTSGSIAGCMSATIACRLFLQTSGNWTLFIDHPALLAAHPHGTGLACVTRTHGFEEFPESARLASLFPGVEDRTNPTAAANFHRCCLRDFKTLNISVSIIPELSPIGYQRDPRRSKMTGLVR